MSGENHIEEHSCLLEEQHGYESKLEPLSGAEVNEALALEEDYVAAAGVGRPQIERVYQAKAATRRNRSLSEIDQIVLHTPEGYEGGTLSVLQNGRAGFDWFLPPSGNLYKTNAFASYVAWQAGYWPSNLRSIGIEQWDFAANMGNAPDAHYRRLAALVAWLTQLLDIPVRHAAWDKPGLVAHAQITPKSRTDPGQNFDWDKLIRYTNELRGLGKDSGGSNPAPEPDERMTRWQWCQDNSGPPATLTYDGKDEWKVTRVTRNVGNLREMTRWEWCQDNSAPAPVVLTWDGKPAWRVEPVGK